MGEFVEARELSVILVPKDPRTQGEAKPNDVQYEIVALNRREGVHTSLCAGQRRQ